MNKKFSYILLNSIAGLLLATTSLSAEEATDLRQGERIEVPASDLPIQEELLSQLKFASKDAPEIQEEISEDPQLETADANYLNRTYIVSRVAETIGNGSLEMEDGSIWGVSDRDAHNLVYWRSQSDQLVITQNTSFFSKYPFRIHNETKGSSVEAKLDMGPFLGRAPLIVSIDPINRIIQLDDGTRWQITGGDNYIYFDRPGGLTQRAWALNDGVIIGANDEFFASFYGRPFILINVNVGGKYARAKRVY